MTSDCLYAISKLGKIRGRQSVTRCFDIERQSGLRELSVWCGYFPAFSSMVVLLGTAG
jgi:hypothetical protein